MADVRLGAHDRRQQAVDQLSYPAESLVLIAGVPGAGKSTLLRRLYDGADSPVTVRILDAEDTRRRWDRWLPASAYHWWRPLMHSAHYARVVRSVAAGGPIVMTDCATRPWVRRMLGRAARRRGLEVHVIVLDVSPDEALAGQQERGRVLGRKSFELHCRRMRQLVDEVLDNPARMIPGATSAVLLGRRTADGLAAIHFDPAA